ncbi:MAG: hypothetical protein Q9209_007528 [Squamulea sp. 1 TL-2023]
MKRFDLGAEDVMNVQSSKKDFIPSQPMALTTLASWSEDGSDERKHLEKMHDDTEYQQILDKRYSVIDILDEVPQLPLPFDVYIDLLIPLSPCLYSISSSPHQHTNTSKGRPVASLTYDVFEDPARSGHGTFHGVASSYLANRRPGDLIPCLVRPTKIPFRLPPDTQTSIIMLAAGAGIAPMRASIQERAAIKRAGEHKPGSALLFFCCRHPDKDFMYRSELAVWESEGIVEVIPCFSKPTDRTKGRHVPDALWEHRERVWKLFKDRANVYTCGSGDVEKDLAREDGEE